MATLKDQQIVDILEENPNKGLVDFAQKQHTKARLHLYGKGLDQYVVPIEGFEKPFLKQLRLKYGTTNVDMFARTLKPVGKVFTARGGTSWYNLKGNLVAKAEQISKQVRSGMSVKKWVEKVWMPHAIDDPMGLIFISVDKNGKAYPTYKCSKTIFDYEPSEVEDGGFEWVVFEVEDKKEKKKYNLPEDEKLYRVVDDALDRYVILKTGADGKKTIEQVGEGTFTNPFGRVPARWCAWSPNPDYEGGVLSPLHYVFGLADAHLLQAGIKVTVMLKHGFPKYWEYGDNCLKCNGSGKFKASICPDCAGIGKQIIIKPGQDKIVAWPNDKTGGLVRGNPGGYIEPSKDAYDILTQELGILEEKINRTLWGSKVTQKLQPGMGLSGAPNGTITATEVMDNRQPEADSMHDISDAAEQIDKFIMDHLILVNLSQKDYINVGGCSKNYGRRYLIEEPDALLDRYEKARSSGLSSMILYGMYEAYLESKFQGDWVSLSLAKKFLLIEPLFHFTLQELKDGGATPEQLRMKIHYADWYASLDSNTRLNSSVKDLLTLRDQYISSKPLPVEEQTQTGGGKPKPKPVK